MNFELIARHIEELFEEQVFEDRIRHHLPLMNPYNVAPWNVGWYPRNIDRNFGRYYRRNRTFLISKRNRRPVHNPALWLPLHIRAQNFGNYISHMQQRVEQMKEKTQFLCQLFNKAEAKWNQPFNGDRSDYVDMLREDSKILWQKYKDFDKVK